MKKTLMAMILVVLFCSAMTPVDQEKATRDAAIEKAISNFVKCRLSKQYNVFTVWIFEKEKDEYDRYEIGDDLIAFSIFANPARTGPPFPILINIDTLGSTRLPTRHIVKDGKLFYWYDPDYGLTQEMIDVLLEYNLAELVPDPLQYDWLGRVYYDDSIKAATYYFCKYDIRRYKRVISISAMGGYKPPKVRCKSLK